MSDSHTKAQIEQMAFETDPSDGLRVKEVRSGNERSLHLGIYAKGRPVAIADDQSASREVWCKSNLTDKDCGDRDRMKLLLEAVCRFINTGGSWAELNWVTSEVKATCGGNTLQFGFPGFHLINSAFNTDGVCEHLFAKDNCPYIIRWVEGQFMDVVTETALLNEARQQASEDVTTDAPGPQSATARCKGELSGPGDSESST